MLDEVIWVVSGQLLCVQLSGRINRDHIQLMNQQCFAMLDAEGQPPAVHVIIDVSSVTYCEPDVLYVKLLQNEVGRHPLVDWVVIVDPHPNAIVRFVGLSLKSLIKFRYHVAKTRDDAVAFILPQLPQSSNR